MMEVDHKDMVDKNYMLFTELLRFKSVAVIRYLYDEQIITEKDAKDAMTLAAHTLRTYRLLDSVLKADSEDVKILYASILYTELWKAADILEPKKRPHQKLYEGVKIDLPEVWPDKAYYEEVAKNGLKIENVNPKDSIMLEWYEEPKKNNIYDMRQTIKGRVLIINNYKFDHSKLSDRYGSLKDANDLENLFKKLGFEPEVHHDLKCQQMKDLFEKESKRDHSKYNCFFLIIMSHGHKGVVYATDSYRIGGDNHHKSLRIEEDIKNKFVHVKSLERKPKVLVIEACQGSYDNRGYKSQDNDEEKDEEFDAEDNEDIGTTQAEGGNDLVDDGDKDGDEEESVADSDGAAKPKTPDDGGDVNEDVGDVAVMPVTQTEGEDDGMDHDQGEDNLGEYEEEENDVMQQEIPDPYSLDIEDGLTAEAPYHVLMAVATTEDHYAYRNTKYGSWFIQAFIFILVNYAWKADLLTLMEKVNELIRRAKIKTTEKARHKAAKTKEALQITEIRTTFIKRFHFFPGMPLEKPRQTKKPSMPFPGLSLPTI